MNKRLPRVPEIVKLVVNIVALEDPDLLEEKEMNSNMSKLSSRLI